MLEDGSNHPALDTNGPVSPRSDIPVAVMRAMVVERGLRVLLVDDNHHHRIPLLRALRDQGHHVLHAADGASAAALCRASPLELDALVTCGGMKHMGGAELARRVGRLHPEIRVLLMGSPFDGPEEARRADALGYAVIAEPFTPEELGSRLAGLLASPPIVASVELQREAEDRLIPREDPILAGGSNTETSPPEEIEPWNTPSAGSATTGWRSCKGRRRS